jgi:hypothetical protein
MAITIVDNRDILDECDSITGWTATDGPAVFTAAPDPVEASGCLAMQASNAVEDAYTSITSDDYSGGGSLTVLMADRAEFASTATGGIGIVVGDGTNRIAYHVGGNDGTGFRHDVGSVKWASFQIDLANKPANFTAIAGSEASLDETAITQVGVRFDTDAKSVGGADNVFWDIIRWADNGVGIEFYGGTVGTPETWDTVTVADRATGNQQAHYLIRLVGTGAYDIQGNINIGDPTSTNDTYINSDTETFLFGDRGQSTDNYYRFNGSGNGTGTTDINFDNCIFNNALSGSMDFSDANITADFRTSTFIGWDQGILTGGSGNIWTDNVFSGCGQLETTGTDLENCTFSGYTGAANTSQLYWNSTSDPNGELDGCEFTMPATLTHAIEFPTGMTSQSITLTNCVFNGYNASNGQNDSTFNVLATTGTLTINIVGGSGNVSYRTAGATVNVVQNPVTTQITVKDINTGALLENARVRLTVTDGVNFPFEASVSATSSGTTATMTHTSHGLATNDYVVVSGANEERYNGCFQITVTGTNTYTYVMSSSTTSPATGTLISTFSYFNTLTNASGVVSDTRSIGSNQAVTGWVRKGSTVGELYQQSPISETISNTAGLTLNVQLIPDE